MRGITHAPSVQNVDKDAVIIVQEYTFTHLQYH